MMKAAIFDMDGLLIDSEPLWQKAEIELFATVGLKLTVDDCLKTQGLRVEEVIDYWYLRSPWKSDISHRELGERIVLRVISLVKEEGEMLSGVMHALETAKEHAEHVALASSSQMRLIDAVVDHLDIRKYFELLYSAENEEFGKPHPGVYITTAKKLGVDPEECIAFEDSFNGLLAAKAAKMTCVSVPDEFLKGDERLAIADHVLGSLEELEGKHFNRI